MFPVMVDLNSSDATYILNYKVLHTLKIDIVNMMNAINRKAYSTINPISEVK